MTAHELHELLQKNLLLAESRRTTWTGNMNTSSSLEEVITCLQHGIAFIKTEDNKMFNYYLKYGHVLNQAFLLYKKHTGIPWKVWLQTNIGIEDSYARKLRSFDKELRPFIKFRRLGMSYLAVYKYFGKIKEMLMHDELAEFWRQP